MSTRYGPATVPVFLLLFATACDPKVTDPPPLTKGEMDIQITGALERSFRSGAGFGTGGGYKIYISGGDSIDGLEMDMLGRNSAPPGSYSLTPRFAVSLDSTADTTGNTAVLRDWQTGDAYIVESGTLTITYAPDQWFASEDEVDGSFDFTAVYWCTGPCRTLPTSFSPDLPRIHVTGVFKAGPPPDVPPL